MKKMRKLATGAAVMTVLAGPMLLVAAPASAATTCTDVSYDGGSGLATANCSGTGDMRFVVTCNAIWPYPAWTKYSDWITVNSGRSVVWQFPTCAASSSVYYQI